jgi:MraZ protein
MGMFAGSHDHVLDDKGRTSLPKEFRLLLAECNGDPWITALPECLAIFTPESFGDFQRKLGDATIAFEPVQQIQRLLIGMASQCPLDKQGRILVPPKLREWAHLDREIVISGVANRIEVWDRTRHRQAMESIRSNYSKLTEPIKEYGL